MSFAVVTRMNARRGFHALGSDGSLPKDDAVQVAPPDHAVCSARFPVYFSDGTCRVPDQLGFEPPKCDDPNLHWDYRADACLSGSPEEAATRTNMKSAAVVMALGLGAGAFLGSIVATVAAGHETANLGKGAAIGAALALYPTYLLASDTAQGIH
jgi:hypothetical protein